MTGMLLQYAVIEPAEGKRGPVIRHANGNLAEARHAAEQLAIAKPGTTFLLFQLVEPVSARLTAVWEKSPPSKG